MPEGSRPRRQQRRLLRHRVHMYAYATVSFALMMMGFVFSGFAIFKRDSEISKIWLAGPTTIAVGLVLCGKVIIDCRPREATDGGDVSGNDGETADVPPSASSQREKGIAMNSERKCVQSAAKDNSLIIENFALGKVLYNQREEVTFLREASDLESDIWHLRDDCSSAVSSCDHHCPHYQLHHHPLCLQNPSARDASDSADGGSSRAHYYHLHSYSTEPEAVAMVSYHTDTMHSSGAYSPPTMSSEHGEIAYPPIAVSTTPPSRYSHCIEDETDSAGSPYQGETFLLNDKQYFI